jgi:hypothetical protein
LEVAVKKLMLTFSTVVALALALTLSAFSKQDDKGALRIQEGRKHLEWVEKSLKEMQTIKVGMTRDDLLKVFEEEGGLSTRKQQRYVYQECPYIKVDVEFEPVEDVNDGLTPYKSDKIVKVSKPYLEWSVED